MLFPSVSLCSILLRVGASALLILALVAVLGACPAQAAPDPDYWTESAQTRDTVYGFFYEQSPQSVPSGYDDVSAEAHQLTLTQAAYVPALPSVPDIWGGIRTTGVADGLIPALRGIGTIGLAVGVADLGWKIGTGINAKYLKIGRPDPPAPKVGAATGTMYFHASGYHPTLNGAAIPDAGWVLQWAYASQYWQSVNLSLGWGSPCAYLTAAPTDMRVLTGTTSNWCVAGPVPVESYWLKENELRAGGPMESYGSQSVDVSTAAPTAPSQSTVESSIASAVAANSALNHWINYQVGSPGESDPTGQEIDNPDSIPFEEVLKKWTKHREGWPEDSPQRDSQPSTGQTQST